MKKLVKTPKVVEKVVEKVTEEVSEVVEVDGGLLTLLNKKVMFIQSNYNYYGTLTGVNGREVELTDPYIVYETGAWSNPAWKDAQKLPTDKAYLAISANEVYFEVNK